MFLFIFFAAEADSRRGLLVQVYTVGRRRSKFLNRLHFRGKYPENFNKYQLRLDVIVEGTEVEIGT